MDDKGWTDAVMAEAERLIPTLLDAGYVSVDDEAATWRFTPQGVARAEDLDRAASSSEAE
jgi:DNA-binding IclR family transcriptional regulator